MVTDADYDRLPYNSVPYAQSQPAHTSGVARLFGLDPVPPEGARILELGCASGGNIIPLAARYPDARLTGIDLSERHVADGRARIAALGLANIEIAQGDIAAADYAGQEFDYVICHGVYSWVPSGAQDAILDIAGRTLAANGVFYVSYNIYPGWHLRTIVRDICLYHAGSGGTPELRVARARWALDRLAEQSSETSPYGQLLRNEAKLNASLPDSYILGEFLATHNAPCFFHEFAARARRHGLAFISETELGASVPETLDPQTAKTIRTIAGSSGMAIEQYMDFFAGRQFRRSLLVRADRSATVNRALSAARLSGLHVSTAFARREGTDQEGGEVFASDRGRLSARDPVLRAILGFLADAAPETRPVAALVAHLRETAVIGGGVADADILRTLFTLVIGGRLTISGAPTTAGRASDTRPAVWRVARQEAAEGQGWLSSRRHEPTTIAKGMRRLVPLIDGSRDRAALCAEALRLIAAGELPAEADDGITKAIPAGDLEALAARHVDDTLATLERAALLEPAAPDDP